MYTKYRDTFLRVQRKLKNNVAFGSLMSMSIFWTKKEKTRAIEMLIDQCIFETLSELEDSNRTTPTKDTPQRKYEKETTKTRI